MPDMTQPQIDEFLERPLIAHVTSLRADGSPHTVPVWYQYADGRFYLFTPSRSVKVRNLRRDPRLTISIASEDEPYRYVVADGTAELSDERPLDRGGAIASRYRGAGGLAYVQDVDSEYDGVTIVSLTPTRMRTWASET